MKFAWIDTQCRHYPLSALCEVLGVSVNGYRAWKRGGTPERQRLTDAQLLTLIRTIHAKFKGAYGSPRMTDEVRSRGFPASKARVERLMSTNGIRARHKRRYRVTTDSRHQFPVAPNVLNRQFTPDEPNQVFTSDITLYLRGVANSFHHTRRGQHGHYVRHQAWDIDVAPRLTFAPIRDRTVAKASPFVR